ncbi:MAG: hypothetical protein JWM06_1670 [Actinomycetia bacterium]|nr:hypothetical protein [Actinomycetes bacterium]
MSATATMTRADLRRRYAELRGLAIVLKCCRTDDLNEYDREPHGFGWMESPLFEQLDEWLDGRTDEVAHDLWPKHHDLDGDPEWHEVSTQADARAAEILASLARAQSYFLNSSIDYAQFARESIDDVTNVRERREAVARLEAVRSGT